MNNSYVIITYPSSKEDLNALKKFMKDHQIPFEISILDSPYKKEFVEKILKGDEEKKKGKGRIISTSELDQLWK
jgi:site-specific DNA-adenine methylase